MTGGDQTIAVVDQSLLTHCAQFPQKYTKRPPKEKETKKMISLSYFECFVSLVRIPCQSTNRSHILIIV